MELDTHKPFFGRSYIVRFHPATEKGSNIQLLTKIYVQLLMGNVLSISNCTSAPTPHVTPQQLSVWRKSRVTIRSLIFPLPLKSSSSVPYLNICKTVCENMPKVKSFALYCKKADSAKKANNSTSAYSSFLTGVLGKLRCSTEHWPPPTTHQSNHKALYPEGPQTSSSGLMQDTSTESPTKPPDCWAPSTLAPWPTEDMIVLVTGSPDHVLKMVLTGSIDEVNMGLTHRA